MFSPFCTSAYLGADGGLLIRFESGCSWWWELYPTCNRDTVKFLGCFHCITQGSVRTFSSRSWFLSHPRSFEAFVVPFTFFRVLKLQKCWRLIPIRVLTFGSSLSKCRHWYHCTDVQISYLIELFVTAMYYLSLPCIMKGELVCLEEQSKMLLPHTDPLRLR